MSTPGIRTSLTEAELAERGGTTPEEVRRLVDLGIIVPDSTGGFPVGDVQRLRLVEACATAGIPPENIAKLIEAGLLSLAFTAFEWAVPWSGFSAKTYRRLAAENGLPLDLVLRLHEAIGFSRPEPEDVVREDDARMFPSLLAVLGTGVDEQVVLRATRVYGENLRRIAQAEAQYFHEQIEMPLMSAGATEGQLRELTAQISERLQPVAEQLILWIYHRHQEHYVVQDLVEHIENAMEQAGLAPKRETAPAAMVFLDLAGYTRLTEEQGDQAAAELAGRLAELVHLESRRLGGLPVKWLGDGVMFHFPDPGNAVRCSLRMVDAAPAAGLPPAHVGVNAGPVVVREGDYFGRTVNIAARIAGQAGPGEVLVSETVVELAASDGFTFTELGPATLKGVSAPVTLFRAGRPVKATGPPYFR